MKRSKLMGSRLSGYSYTEKKSKWKWTPIKIAAFTMFGIMVSTIVYVESNYNRKPSEAPSPSVEQPALTVETTDFNKEYQDFLKQGKKIITAETLDSLETIQSDTRELPTESNTSSINQPVISQTRKESKHSTPKPASRQPSDKAVEGNLELIELTPSTKKAPSSNVGRSTLGTLEETTPPVVARVDNSEKEVDDNSITEEFYVEETITGVVASASDGRALQGVAISVKDTKISTTSDAKGGYSIAVPGDPEHRTIQYSFRGNLTERDVSPGTSVINVRF